MISLCVQRFYFVNKARHRPHPPPPHSKTPHALYKRGHLSSHRGGRRRALNPRTRPKNFPKADVTKKTLDIAPTICYNAVAVGINCDSKGADANIIKFMRTRCRGCARRYMSKQAFESSCPQLITKEASSAMERHYVSQRKSVSFLWHKIYNVDTKTGILHGGV